MRSSEKAVPGLKRALAPFPLINLRIGAVLGADAFARTGLCTVPFTGPGAAIRFAISGSGCLFAGLCLNEYASVIPVTSGACTYRVQ